MPQRNGVNTLSGAVNYLVWRVAGYESKQSASPISFIERFLSWLRRSTHLSLLAIRTINFVLSYRSDLLGASVVAARLHWRLVPPRKSTSRLTTFNCMPPIIIMLCKRKIHQVASHCECAEDRALGPHRVAATNLVLLLGPELCVGTT